MTTTPKKGRPRSILDDDYDNPDHWKAEISSPGLWPWTPYRVQLTCGLMTYGGDGGWGWSRMTWAGARKTADRQLRKKRNKMTKEQARNAWIKANYRAK